MITSPTLPRAGEDPSAARTSTTHQRSSSACAATGSGTGVEKFTRTGASPHVPARRPATEAGSVAETLTTSRSLRVQQLRELVEAGVEQRAALPVGDHQPDAVTPEAAVLRRLGRFQMGRQLEGEGAHKTTSPGASSRAE